MVAVQAAAAADVVVVVVVVVVELGWGGVATPYCPARLINESGVELRVASEVELWSRDDNG